MQYWEEMDSKYGFSDGEAYPAGILIYRDIYIKTVNKLAEKHGSAVRVIPFDRGGCHNTVMKFEVSKDWYEKEYLPKQKGEYLESYAPPADTLPERAEIDDGFRAAIEEAMDLDVDGFVIVNPVVDKEFVSFLAGIK